MGEGDRRPTVSGEASIEPAGRVESRHQQLVPVGRLRGKAGDDDLAVSLHRYVCGGVVAMSRGEVEGPCSIPREAVVEVSVRLEPRHGDIGAEHRRTRVARLDDLLITLDGDALADIHAVPCADPRRRPAVAGERLVEGPGVGAPGHRCRDCDCRGDEYRDAHEPPVQPSTRAPRCHPAEPLSLRGAVASSEALDSSHGQSSKLSIARLMTGRDRAQREGGAAPTTTVVERAPATMHASSR